MKTYTDELYIYPKVAGVLLSWKVTKGLNILPECYPNLNIVNSISIPAHRSHTPTSEEIMKEFPTVFSGRTKTMEGKQFYIHTSFMYWDKPKSKLDPL